MTLEIHTNLGKRVVVLGGTRLASLREWLAELALASPGVKQGGADALLLDFRAEEFTPSAREANALVTALRVLCARRAPPVAILANPGAQFGGVRMLCTLGELGGCRTAPFRDEAEAWGWLQRQLESSGIDDAPGHSETQVSA